VYEGFSENKIDTGNKCSLVRVEKFNPLFLEEDFKWNKKEYDSDFSTDSDDSQNAWKDYGETPSESDDSDDGTSNGKNSGTTDEDIDNFNEFDEDYDTEL